MKKLILLFSTIVFLTSCYSQKSHTIYLMNAPIRMTIEDTTLDDGYYNGFSMTEKDTTSNYDLYDLVKAGPDHASSGWLTHTKTSDGGRNITKWKPRIDGDTLQSPAHSFMIIKYGTYAGRFVLAYQPNEDYDSIIIAVSDDKGLNYSKKAIFTGTEISPTPVKMRQFKDGTILFGYYQYFNGSNSKIAFKEGTFDAETWTNGSSIFEHGGTGFGDDNGYEFGFEIVEDDGERSTAKMVACVRNASQIPYLWYTSNDGGVTWETDLVTVNNPGAYAAAYLYNHGGYSSLSPVDVIVHNDSVYVINGYRDQSVSGTYKIQYIKTSIAKAITNNFHDWEGPIVVAEFDQNNVHFGYPVSFHDYQNKLFARFYNVSNKAENGLGSPRCYIYQIKIAD